MRFSVMTFHTRRVAVVMDGDREGYRLHRIYSRIACYNYAEAIRVADALNAVEDRNADIQVWFQTGGKTVWINVGEVKRLADELHELAEEIMTEPTIGPGRRAV